MEDIDAFDKLYQEGGPAAADGYCESKRLIGSVCLTCKRAYRLVPSQRDGGGLSHGWCSADCTPPTETTRYIKPGSSAPGLDGMDHPAPEL
ncbi:MAG: hypothetical protein JJT88_11540 [Gammaproteobacteria bacterium]|nr:hypothetical protein [Gammaproteobacteria bacterium]